MPILKFSPTLGSGCHPGLPVKVKYLGMFLAPSWWLCLHRAYWIEEGREQVSEKDREPPPSRHAYIHESGGFLEGLQSAHRRGGRKSKIWLSKGFVSGGAQSWRCIEKVYVRARWRSDPGWSVYIHQLPDFCNILTNFLSLLAITRRVLLLWRVLLLLGVQTGFFPHWAASVFAVIGWYHTTHCCCQISLWLGIFCINSLTLGLFRSKWGQFPFE